MPFTKEEIEHKLRTSLDASYVAVEDMSDGCGAKFDCVIVSRQFEGKPLLQRHRLVHSALAEEMKTIHALTQKTLTPEQWQQQQQQQS